MFGAKIFAHELLEASEEEEEEERQNMAASRLQALFRAKRARKFFRHLLMAQYVKIWDPTREAFVYKNKGSGAIHSTKPKIFGDKDIEAQDFYVAPTDYVPRRSLCNQVAFVATVAHFGSPRIPNIHGSVLTDHRRLRSALVHPYLCAFPPDNCFFLENCTFESFVTALSSLRRVVESEAFSSLLVIVQTHVAKLTSRADKGAYLLMADSQWTSTRMAAKTSVKLDDFCAELRDIKCEHKTVILDVAHNLKPPDSIFRTRFVYPPPNVGEMAAKLLECPVILSASVAGPSATQQRGQSSSKDAGGSTDAEKKAEDRIATQAAKKVPLKRSSRNKAPRQASGKQPGFASSEEDPETSRPVTSKSLDAEGKPPTRAAGTMLEDMPGDGVPNQDVGPATELEQGVSGFSNATRRRRSERLPGDQLPSEQLYEGDAEEAEKLANERGKTKNEAARQRAVRKAEAKALKDARRRAGYETCVHGRTVEEGSVFGNALLRAVSGEACTAEEPRLRLERLVNFLTTNVPVEAQKRNASQHPVLSVSATCEERLSGNAGNGSGGSADLAQGGAQARPIVALEEGEELSEAEVEYRGAQSAWMKIGRAADVTVCEIPSPPPAPFPPECIESTYTSIGIRWQIPHFSGDPPTRYAVQMRGFGRVSRREWKDVVPTYDISARNVSIPRLVPGMKHTFRVRGRNKGGWGEWSAPSRAMWANMSTKTVSLKESFRKAARTGPRAVLRCLTKFEEIALAKNMGLAKLAAIGAQYRGIGKHSIKLGKATIRDAKHTMERYSMDAKLQKHACLCIGWACFQCDEVTKCAREEGVESPISDAVKRFPHDVALAAAASFARSVLAAASTPEVPQVDRPNESSSA